MKLLSLHGQTCSRTGTFDILISLFTERVVKMPEHSHLGEIKLDSKRLTHAPFRSSVRLVLRRGDTSPALECFQMLCFWEDEKGGLRGRDSVTCARTSDSGRRGECCTFGQAQHANAVPTCNLLVAKLLPLLDLGNMKSV